MNKIGLLTFHSSDNYGALLQTYALQRTIEYLGGECEVLDYHCSNKEDAYKRLLIGSNYSLKTNLISFINYPIKNKKFKQSEEFRKNKLNISKKRYNNFEEILEVNNNYDKFIVGSDQVWNHKNTGFDKVYLLNFVEDDNKKYSYAASFGISKIEKEKEYAELLNSFKKISVRENEGKEIVESLVDKEAVVALDPTFLLTAQEWRSFSSGEIINEKYIFVYSLQMQDELWREVFKLASLYKLKVVVVNMHYKYLLKNGEKIIPTVEKFVNYIDNAALVITDSFHGLALSLNLNKKVLLVKNGVANSRLDSLISLLDAQEMLNKVKKDGINANIDWFNINKNIETYRKSSLKYLQDVLDD